MIEVFHVNKSFDDNVVLEDINLKIKNGSIMGLVGINGAGKSTLLRLISGVYYPDKGNITIDGESVYDNPKVKNQLFYLPDEPYFSTHSTPRTLLEFFKHFYEVDENIYFKYLNLFELNVDQSIHNFSKGMKRQVFVSLAIAIKPKYLLLDEAFDGLDPIARLEMKKALISLVSINKTSVIISSHSLRELEDICDAYALIDNKNIASSGDIIENLNKYHKYVIAFDKEVDINDFNIKFVKFEKDKRIIKVIVEEDYEMFSKSIAKLNPLIIDEIRIDFEELFIIEVENRGYLK